jgi:2-polyprenyl-3-methyl-5-hydroxy-6-metoxy-1,4-benzoquinol methylase
VILSRTIHNIRNDFKEFIFDHGNFQDLIDQRRKKLLEDSMGFRGQWEEHRRFQLALLKDKGLAPSDHLLEIGCGPLTAGLPLIEYLAPDRYVGIDVRSSVLNLAWGEIGRACLSAKNPRLICSSSFGSEELGQQRFEYVLSFSVLYHLDDPLVQHFFFAMANRLTEGGMCLANINTDVDDSTWLEFPFLKRSADTYRAMAGAAGLQTESLGSIESLGFRLRGQERLNEMLLFRR